MIRFVQTDIYNRPQEPQEAESAAKSAMHPISYGTDRLEDLDDNVTAVKEFVGRLFSVLVEKNLLTTKEATQILGYNWEPHLEGK